MEATLLIFKLNAMKFTTTTMTTFYANSHRAINNIEHNVPITSFMNGGKEIVLNGNKYSRIYVAGKHMYIAGDVPSVNKTCSIQIPGSPIGLWLMETYAVPTHPEDDEWDFQSIQVVINTARLRELVTGLVPDLNILSSCLASKAVNVLDANGNRSIADVVEKPLAKLIKQLEELTEATAQNFKP